MPHEMIPPGWVDLARSAQDAAAPRYGVDPDPRPCASGVAFMAPRSTPVGGCCWTSAVDLDNRLVAGELEARWNDALIHVGQLEADRDEESCRVRRRRRSRRPLLPSHHSTKEVAECSSVASRSF